MDEWKIFAEDEGTGLTMQRYRDRGDGAHFNAQSHNPNAVDFSVVNPLLTPDWTNNELQLSSAQYRIKATDVRSRIRNGEVTEWPEVTFTVFSPDETVTFPDSQISNVFVDIDVDGTEGDVGRYVVEDVNVTPSEPSLLVAQIDATEETVQPKNIRPEGEYEEVNLNGMRSLTYDEEADSIVVDTRPDGGTKAYEVVTVEDLQNMDFGGEMEEKAKTKQGVLDTQKSDDAVVFNTEGRNTFTISVEADTKTKFAIDASVNGNDWMESWDVFETAAVHRDTYQTGMPYIRVRVESPSSDEGQANIVMSAS